MFWPEGLCQLQIKYKVRSNQEWLAPTEKGWHQLKCWILLCSGKCDYIWTIFEKIKIKWNSIKKWRHALLLISMFGVQDGFPDGWEVTVQVHGPLVASDFGGSPCPISPHWPHDSRILSLITVFILGHMHWDAIVVVTSQHCTCVRSVRSSLLF